MDEGDDEDENEANDETVEGEAAALRKTLTDKEALAKLTRMRL